MQQYGGNMIKAGNFLKSGTRENAALVILLLLAILANAAIYAVTHAEGPSGYADDPNYTYLASSVIHGQYQLNTGYIFSLRPGQFLPIAFFYYILGITNLTSTLWDITGYLGGIIATFLMVRALYNNKGALLAAYLLSVFPLLTKYAVNTEEDVPLMFIGTLAILFFIYAERTKKKSWFFASGAMVSFSWFISYEAGVVIAFMLLLALIELLRRKIAIDRSSIFFVYGIAIPMLIAFIYSASAIGHPFAFITSNSRFYSTVGVEINGKPTIPTTNVNLSYYIQEMFQYQLVTRLMQPGSLQNKFSQMVNLFSVIPQNYEYGVYFYMLIPALAALLILREKRAVLFIFTFAFFFLFLEFGPMHVGITLSPLSFQYVLAYRLHRFFMILAPELAAIIGIALAKTLEVKNRYIVCIDLILVLLLLVFLYWNNYMISYSYYWWQMYPEQIVMQAADFVRYNVTGYPLIYLEAYWHNTTVTYTGALFPTYFGDPSTSRVVFDITNTTPCSDFLPHNYVIWSGPPKCSEWVNVLNITIPKDAPAYYVKYETPTLIYRPTNVYYIE
ncbi:MAG: glycosyltransferase family 39 protein [Candidatus Micrarchaeaceae archaeon]